ncbi:MAG: type II secretion system GspH family protein [Crocinitomicaceae bacterium]|nr:type II secretion system GspH family protein [Crocinitomicaceae bacterium]
MRNRQGHISAFTILEVTIVVAIMGILITIVSMTFNRFSEQLKISSEIHGELNNLFVVRSNLWTELYEMDSVQFENRELSLFIDDRIIKYREEQQQLERFQSNHWNMTKIALNEIRLEEEKETQRIVFDFLWKGEIMTLDYYFKPDKKNQINAYFENLNE